MHARGAARSVTDTGTAPPVGSPDTQFHRRPALFSSPYAVLNNARTARPAHPFRLPSLPAVPYGGRLNGYEERPVGRYG
ncbi:hypothetical protein GCM10010398_57580 [Streptomyces fimbriatus]